MSLDRSLKGKSTLERHRNVLRRAERVTMLEDNEKWTEATGSVFGMVKVAHRKQAAAKKAPKAEVAVEGAVAAVPGAPAAPTAAAAAPVAKAGAKPAAKPAAPAKK